ncbi:YrdB family protein [Specibacter sp. RAF43]|uniref:YrdB family protein n=1 Tax=Specibacter sp. RAF43 TaxID=3233057 RepID=UPI003F980E7D
MGRRSAQGPAPVLAGRTAVRAAVAAVGFALEVAMVAAFLFWGFRSDPPWHLVLGIGVPALVVVLWGIFLAPKSRRRLPEDTVAWVSLGVFVLAGLALVAAGADTAGLAMLAVSVAYFATSTILRRR